VHKEDSYQKTVLLPGLLKLLDLKGTEAIVEIGSGDGFFSKSLAAHAKSVVGVELSPEMVALANEKRLRNVSFLVGDAQKLPKFKELFDVAVIMMAIQNIPDLDAALRNAARSLKSSGRLVVVMNHPVLRVPRQSSWGWDETKKMQYRRIDTYLSEQKIPIAMHPGSGQKEVTWSFHRPLEAYFKSLKSAGFVVADLQEWISPRESEGGRARAENRARTEFPLFLAIEAKKI